MNDATYYTKRILYGIGKAFYLVGKGIHFLLKALAKDVSIAYQNYQERQRIEEARRRYYRGIERENYAAGRGWARGMANVREEDRIGRENNYARRNAVRRFEKQMFDDPKINESFFLQDFSPKKRKGKRRCW